MAYITLSAVTHCTNNRPRTQRRLTIIDALNRGNTKGEADTKKAVKKGKERYSITLSHQSEQLLEELKEFTDAETVTEVFRDSIRLSYLVMNAQKKGLRVEIHDPSDPKSRPALVGVGHSIPG
jgi:aryl carrier-like protein